MTLLIFFHKIIFRFDLTVDSLELMVIWIGKWSLSNGSEMTLMLVRLNKSADTRLRSIRLEEVADTLVGLLELRILRLLSMIQFKTFSQSPDLVWEPRAGCLTLKSPIIMNGSTSWRARLLSQFAENLPLGE